MCKLERFPKRIIGFDVSTELHVNANEVVGVVWVCEEPGEAVPSEYCI